jgi:microcystin-dependent protein
MTLYKWSQTASADATADSTINWAEGQAPSSVNDSARAMMAATAKYRDDIAGAIVTTGTNTAYAVSSYQGFDTLAHLSGRVIAFTPHATNGATVTLNVDVLGPKPLRTAPGVELVAGVIIQGTPYTALYNNADGAFYLQGVFGNPYSIPIAGGLDYWAATAPNSSFAFPVGQAISRTTYSALFALVGTTYGSGDGSTTFNLPDKRGRVSAATDDMGGSSAFRLTSAIIGFGAVAHPGAVGGAESHTLTDTEVPPVAFGGITGTENQNHTHSGVATGAAGLYSSPGGATIVVQSINSGTSGTENQNHNHNFSGNIAGGGGGHLNVQPTIVCNYVIRII